MDKLKFEFCQGVFQGRQEITDKIKSLISELEGDYPHADNITKVAIHSFIEDLKQVMGKDTDD